MKYKAKVLVDFRDFTLVELTNEFAVDGVYNCTEVEDRVWRMMVDENRLNSNPNMRWVKVEVDM